MNISEPTKENIKLAAEIIKNGGLVAFPTETVYGLGADGLNPIASAKIFEVKKRPSFNPLILHISEKNQLSKYCFFEDERIEKLINIFWPGPLTLVLPKTDLVPDIVTSGNPTVAIRMPNHKIALELIERCETPIAAPSANKFGHLSPTEALHVKKSLGNRVDMILDGGKSEVGVESTIIQFEESKFYLLRPGGLSKEEIENVIGRVESGRINLEKPNAPGQLPYHYAPSIPLCFLSDYMIKKHKGKKIGVLFAKKQNLNYDFTSVKILSEKGDMKESAANLFKHLHDFEKENIDIIMVEKLEERGLGLAIMDRLKKAAKRYEETR